MSSPTDPRPNWADFMQCATFHSEFSPKKSTVDFLPIIDLNSSNETCIYSTLRFIIEQAVKLGVKYPCVTFDQPSTEIALGILFSINFFSNDA